MKTNRNTKMNRQKHFEKEKGKQKNQNTLFSLGKKTFAKRENAEVKYFFSPTFAFM